MSNSPELARTSPPEIDVSRIPYKEVSVMACQTLIEHGPINTGAPVYNLAKQAGVSPLQLKNIFIWTHGRKNQLWRGDLRNEDKSQRFIEIDEAGLAYGLSYKPILEPRLNPQFPFSAYYLLKVLDDGGGAVSIGNGTDKVYGEIYNRLLEEGYDKITYDSVPRSVMYVEEIDCCEIITLPGELDKKERVKSVRLTDEGKDFLQSLETQYDEMGNKSIKEASRADLCENIAHIQAEIKHQAKILGVDFQPIELSGQETRSELRMIIGRLDIKLNTQIAEIDERRRTSRSLGFLAARR